jgi:hypothetical protein
VNTLKSVLASAWAGAIVLCLGATIHPAFAGTVILEGSDAIGYHSGSVASATAYRDQVWSAIGGSSPKPIAVIGPEPVSAGTIGSGTHAISLFNDVASAGALGDYSALYFLAASGCCAADDSLVTAAGAAAAISTYLTGGGTIMIENSIGGAAWDFAVGAGGAGNSHVQGFGGGYPGGSTCSDGETVTADGLANGFTQPGTLSCWTHQAYDVSFFAPLGFTHTFFDAGPDYVTGFSSLLSSGLTETGGGTVPEPATLLLVGGALLALARTSWKRRQN